MSQAETNPKISRRGLFRLAGAGAVLAAAPVLAPSPALAGPAEVDAAIKKIAGDKKPQSGKIHLKAPQIAENGATVPFTVTVDSPMTDKDHVKAIHVFADGNPAPGVASFQLGPRAGKAEISMRMRMAKTQNVRAIALMSDGSVFEATQEVKVTIGGCGG